MFRSLSATSRRLIQPIFAVGVVGTGSYFYSVANADTAVQVTRGDTTVKITVEGDGGTSSKSMVHIPSIVAKAMSFNGEVPNMTELPDDAGAAKTETWLEDFGFSKVPGKELTGGLFRMNKGNALEYTYSYDEIKLILEGEFHLKDGTGQSVVAKAGDVMYFPKGCRTTFDTPDTAVGYFVGQRKQDASASVEDKTLNPRMKHVKQINKIKLPALDGVPNTNTFLDDLIVSKPEDSSTQMAGGLFRMHKGEPLKYAYDYEELKLIVQGEFHLTDGTGQQVVAKAGDLMYFPNGSEIVFDTPSSALGFFVGQRQEGTA